MAGEDWGGYKRDEFDESAHPEAEVPDPMIAINGAIFGRVGTPNGPKMMPSVLLLRATRDTDWVLYRTYEPAPVGAMANVGIPERLVAQADKYHKPRTASIPLATSQPQATS